MAAPTAAAAPNSFVSIVRKVKPAVVKVVSEAVVEAALHVRRRFLRPVLQVPPGARKSAPASGSGFFISADGYILTNNHVVQDAVKVKIFDIDKKEFTAKIIGTDPKTDLALLKVNAQNVPFIDLGDSNSVEVGEWVLAIGNPFNQDLTVTSGIISAKGRQLGLAQYEDFLQTDASINMGNSGGPLINMKGEAIGINSTILTPSSGSIGIGFAIPTNMAKKVVADLKTKGKVVRGWFGIQISDINESDAKDLDLADRRRAGPEGGGEFPGPEGRLEALRPDRGHQRPGGQVGCRPADGDRQLGARRRDQRHHLPQPRQAGAQGQGERGPGCRQGAGRGGRAAA